MECKELSGFRQVEWQECINRNIVECKDRWTAEYQDFSGINRNIVECKASFSLNCTAGRPVLIETLWNVKAFS